MQRVDTYVGRSVRSNEYGGTDLAADPLGTALPQVTGEGDDKYLIATAEQPLCALHRNQWMDTKAVPMK